jgi:hypothetical protein
LVGEGVVREEQEDLFFSVEILERAMHCSKEAYSIVNSNGRKGRIKWVGTSGTAGKPIESQIIQ